MLNFIDDILDRVTMYRLLIYYLVFLLVVGVSASWLGYINFNALSIAGTAVYMLAACWIINQIFARLLKIPINNDSTYITALILALIISPGFTAYGIQFMTAAAGLAIASKYLITYNRRHIFNPAAIALVLMALGPGQTASWWVGNPAMMPFVLVGGLLLVRRIRRGAMLTSFFATALAAGAVFTMLNSGNVISTWHHMIFSSALLFLGFVMLTEPLTSPATKGQQIIYGALTGLLFPPQVHLAGFYSTPERALSLSNLYAFIVNPKVKIFPILSQKQRITQDSLDFIFGTDKKFKYKPGQYMEWTLPHDSPDSRGQRRYFTLASSPTEPTIRLGIKFYQNGSSYKEAMLAMGRMTPIIGSSLGGDFVMPSDRSRKLAWIAGGIGATPYRSMAKYLIDRREQRDVSMLYSAASAADIAYMDVFEQARSQLGLKILYTLTRPDTQAPDNRYRHGKLTAEMIASEIPDYSERLFYISGPHEMVHAVDRTLKSLGVSRSQIKKDFFSGYA